MLEEGECDLECLVSSAHVLKASSKAQWKHLDGKQLMGSVGINAWLCSFPPPQIPPSTVQVQCTLINIKAAKMSLFHLISKA